MKEGKGWPGHASNASATEAGGGSAWAGAGDNHAQRKDLGED